MNTRLLFPHSSPDLPINSLTLHLENLYRRHFVPEYPGVIELAGLAKDPLLKWVEGEQFAKVYPYLRNTLNEKRLEMSSAVYVAAYGLIYIEWGAREARVVVYFPETHTDEARNVAEHFLALNHQQKREAQVHLLVKKGDKLALQAETLVRREIHVEKHFGTDFLKVYSHLVQELRQSRNPGLALIGGKPGTGKTTLLRQLLGEIFPLKPILVISPDLFHVLTQPEALALLLEHPDVLIVVEDGDVLLQRFNALPNPGLAALLNLTDGILAGIVNAQVVITYNNEHVKIESALLRGGRLMAHAQLDILDRKRAAELADHYGLERDPSGGETLADLFQPLDPELTGQPEKVGIRLGR